MTPVDLIRDRLTARGFETRGAQTNFAARCPAHTPSHGSTNRSLSVKEGNDGRALVRCHWDPPCSHEAIVAALDLTVGDLFADNGRGPTAKQVDPPRRQTAAYGYHDEHGNLLYEAVRYHTKEFRQRRPDGNGGWTWSTKGVRRVPYRLPELREAIAAGRMVFIVEGEKDAERLAQAGLVATCNVGGAGKWLPEYTPHFGGAHVAVIGDNDEAGREHVAQVAKALHPAAASVKVIDLPGLPPRGDVSDWLDAGHDRHELETVVSGTKPLGDSDVEQLQGDAAAPELMFTVLADLRAQIAARGPRRYLLRGIWPAGAYGVHAAEMKAQKSWNALDLAVSVASGTPWLGHVPVDDQGTVIVFWGEGDDAGLVRRIDAIAQSRDLDPDLLPIVVCCRVPHLTQQDHLDLVADVLRKTSAKLVVLDPLYLAARGAKSSDLYEMGAHLETVQHICQRAAAALIVVTHYNRKSGRGAGRITGAGPAEWGRVLIGATVKSRHTDPDTKATSVVTELDIIGGEIPDSTLRIHRRIHADDPDDLDSPLHYQVDVTETNGQTNDHELKPAEEKLLEALQAIAAPLDPQPIDKLVDWIADKYGHGLTRETCSKSLNRLAELDLADGVGDPGKPKVWWPLDEGGP